MEQVIIEDSTDPLYIQLANLIENKILSGEIKQGEKIPSEGALMTEYKLSRVTVRNAIQKLADEGKVEKKQGKGAYVSFTVFKESFSAGGSFTSSGETLKSSPSSEIMSKKKYTLDEKMQTQFGFETAKVIEIKRLRKIKGQPVIFEIDYFIPEMQSICEKITNQDSLIELLKKNGYEINHFDNTIDIVFAKKEISEILQVKIGSPLVHIVQQVLDSNNKLIYTNEQYINSDLYKVAIRSY